MQQVQRLLQPWEMERGVCGCQGVSPVGSNLREGTVRGTSGGRCCLLPLSLPPPLPSKMGVLIQLCLHLTQVLMGGTCEWYPEKGGTNDGQVLKCPGMGEQSWALGGWSVVEIL